MCSCHSSSRGRVWYYFVDDLLPFILRKLQFSPLYVRCNVYVLLLRVREKNSRKIRLIYWRLILHQYIHQSFPSTFNTHCMEIRKICAYIICECVRFLLLWVFLSSYFLWITSHHPKRSDVNLFKQNICTDVGSVSAVNGPRLIWFL